MDGTVGGIAEPAEQEMRPISDYVRSLRRRAWLVLLLAAVGVAAGLAIAASKTTQYQASSQVLITHAAGAGSNLNVQEAARLAQTQAQLALLPAVASRVLTAAKLHDRTAQDFLNEATATAATNSDLITLTVTDRSSALAQKLVALYASQFVAYEQGLQTTISRRLQSEFAQSAPSTPSTGSSAKQSGALTAQQLQALAMPAGGTLVVGASGQVTRLGKETARYGVIGLAVGLVLGFIVAFVLEALDTRIRSDRRVGARLGVALLGRLPKPRRRLRLRPANGLVMSQRPRSDDADAYRWLCASLEARNLDLHAQVIAFTGAHADSGSTTTVANVAIALARAGRRILVIDSDFRRPRLHRLFKVEGSPGLADVALGSVSLDEAIHTVEIHQPGELAMPGARSHGPGTLGVLAAGSVPANVNVMELLESAALENVIGELRDRAELLLLASPSLPNGEGRAACQRAEALVICLRANTVREPALVDLSETLATVSAPTLGMVTTDARRADCHGSHHSGERWWRALRVRGRYA